MLRQSAEGKKSTFGRTLLTEKSYFHPYFLNVFQCAAELAAGVFLANI